MGSRQSFATPHSRVPSAMIGQYTLKPDTHSNRDTGLIEFSIAKLWQNVRFPTFTKIRLGSYTGLFSMGIPRYGIDCMGIEFFGRVLTDVTTLPIKLRWR